MLAAALAIGAAAGVAGAPTGAPDRPPPERFESVRARLMRAKRVVVSPACGSVIAPWARRGSHGARHRLTAYTRTEQDQAWSREFVAALLRPSDWDTAYKFRGVSKPCDQTHRVPLFAVTWRGGADAYALLSFESRCALVFEADRPLGAVRFDDRADTLFALLRRAMPDDSLLRDMTTPAATRPRLEESIRVAIFVEKLPEVIEKVRPDYPEDAVRAGVEGTVLIQALVDTTGAVQDAFVARSSARLHPLDDPALDAVWRWKFTPAATAEGPVPVWVVVPVKFTLR